MASLSLNNVFDEDNITCLGRSLVRVAYCVPRCIVANTRLMRCIFRCIWGCANSKGKARSDHKRKTYVAKTLGLEQSFHDIPCLEYGERGGFKFPLVLATDQQQYLFHLERTAVQVTPQMSMQVDTIFRTKTPGETVLPDRALVWWLRMSMLHTPANWYLKRQFEHDGSSLLLDFAPVCDDIDHESANCKYNIRDIKVTDSGEISANELTSLTCVERFTTNEHNKDQRQLLRHTVFLSLTMVQQACEVGYHNWIHFYFNDWVLFEVQSHVLPGHWIRQLLDPHMRYQTVINNAGMFSQVANKVVNNEVYDEVLFGAKLTSWTLTTFNNSIIDRTLGYYLRTNHSSCCAETRQLNFNLNRLVGERPEGIQLLIQKLDSAVQIFVGDVIDAYAKGKDLSLMAMINDHVLKFCHRGCLEGIADKDNNPKGIFKLIISRYILQAGILHGLEHFEMYFWLAPLRLPQRIRQFLDTSMTLDEYSYDVDKHNGYFGHEMFTRYWPNIDGKWSWGSLEYEFEDSVALAKSREFVQCIRRLLHDYDREVLHPAREVLQDHGIPFPSHCVLTPERIGTSICM